MSIRLLPDNLVNQIAAGEVIERPASAIKELVENAIDAGSSVISVSIRDGGKSHIKIADNGRGMNADDLSSCILRHATSKLEDDNLFNIKTMGFRGEALPSIGAISRLSIISKTIDDEIAHTIRVDGGKVSSVEIAPPNLIANNSGTVIEVNDLFFATPARLKFLKQSSTETNHIVELINRIAMANPQVSLALKDEKRTILNYPKSSGLLDRLTQVIGKDFTKNSAEIDSICGNTTVYGYCGLPTLNRANASQQFMFVNNRPVKDKLLNAAVRIAYQDFLAPNRYPIIAIYIEIDPREVDINVHPAKTEVRFRDPGNIRNLLVKAIRSSLEKSGSKTSSTVSDGIIAKFIPNNSASKNTIINSSHNFNTNVKPKSSTSLKRFSNIAQSPTTATRYYTSADQNADQNIENSKAINYTASTLESSISPSVAEYVPSSFETDSYTPHSSSSSNFNFNSSFNPNNDNNNNDKDNNNIQLNNISNYPMGFAKAHIHGNYIISQTQHGMIIVDQHAAHERITYETLKKMHKEKGIQRQILLVPEVVELASENQLQLITASETLNQLKEFGLVIEKFGNNSVIVRETPSILGSFNIKKMINDIADELESMGDSILLHEKINEVLSSAACHKSIRSGRKLNIEEMNQLLRQMEETNFSGQCNHGRPTYVELKLSDIEKLFGRR